MIRPRRTIIGMNADPYSLALQGRRSVFVFDGEHVAVARIDVHFLHA